MDSLQLRVLHLLLLTISTRTSLPLKLGQKARLQNFGFVVQIYDSKFLAAGSLFTARYILTVAHCFDQKIKAEQLTVRAGSLRIEREFRGGKPVAGIYKHPQFTLMNLANDIAVLRVKNPIMFSDSISYIPLCTGSLGNNAASETVIAGWSLLNISEPLKSIKVTLNTQKECRSRFPQLPRGVACAEKAKGEGLCYGDSGDPLIRGGQVCGMATAFRRCGDQRYPDLFTEVYYHRSFIAQAIGSLDREMLKEMG